MHNCDFIPQSGKVTQVIGTEDPMMIIGENYSGQSPCLSTPNLFVLLLSSLFESKFPFCLEMPTYLAFGAFPID
jgi:hypothetical protein